MKRILTLLIILFSAANIYAQRNLAEARPVWFGVNMGGTWQTSDMKPLGGIGWGFTVSRYSRISSPSPLYWGWRFRFLDGRNYGYNYHALTGISNNPVLSSGTTNYSSGTDPDTGFIYSNYKMRFDEFAGELIIGSNTLRKHGVLVYGFGGVGMTYWKTMTDQLDMSGNMYDYSTVTNNGDPTAVETQLDAMWDKEYETAANGSQSGAQWGFMPSAGFGFGYQWSNFSIAMEHRTTWSLGDIIDGTTHNYAGPGTDDGNDLYHYDGLTLKWNFHSKSDNNSNNNVPPPPPPPNPNNYNQPPPNNNNNQTVPHNDPNPGNNNQTPVNPNLPIQPPTVTFTTPNVDPYNAATTNQNLVVRVTGVTTKSQISLTINNVVSTDYQFNPATNTMTFSHTLLPGNNTYRVVATNQAGSAQDVQTIIYKSGNQPSGTPPTVVITAPASDPYTSTTNTYNVVSTITNVASASNVTVTKNGQPITNFTYNPQTGICTFTASLSTGNNTYVVSGSNSYGTASDQVTIVYGNANTVQPPVVTITNPNACPYQTKVQNHTLTANITNVSNKNQVTVVFNNQSITNFTYTQNGANASISFPVVLVSGANPFTVSATNTAGADSKACEITYKPSSPAVVPPDVNITVPSSDPYASNNPAFTLKATVLNVAGSSEISMTANGNPVINWSYDMNSHVLTYNTTLSQGQVKYIITASNANGTDSDEQTVTYKADPVVLPPTVTFTNPANSAVTVTSPQQTLTATVMNVTQQSQITVTKAPHSAVPFTFNAATHVVTFSTTLALGATQFTVTATNTAGTASDNVTITYNTTTQGNGGSSTVGGGSPGNNPGNGGNGNINGGQSAGNGGDQGRPGGNPPAGPAPTIDLHVPSSSPVTIGSTSLNVVMIVMNVSSVSEITVRVNQVVQTSGINYNASTHQLSFTATLVNGQNSIQVMAQNANGTAQRGLVVNCNATNKVQQDPPKSPAPAAEPKKAESKPEPKKDEPKPAEPKKAEPKKEEPKRAEPRKIEPKPAEPKPAEPKPAPAPAASPSRPR